jgi:hypothetical protein
MEYCSSFPLLVINNSLVITFNAKSNGNKGCVFGINVTSNKSLFVLGLHIATLLVPKLAT